MQQCRHDNNGQRIKTCQFNTQEALVTSISMATNATLPVSANDALGIYSQYLDAASWGTAKISDAAMVMVILLALIGFIEYIGLFLRHVGLITSAFYRLKSRFMLLIISLLMFSLRGIGGPFIAALLPEATSSKFMPKSLLTVCVGIIASVLFLKYFLQIGLVLYGLYKNEPFKNIISKVPLNELRRKVQKRIVKKKMPHLVVSLVVSKSFKHAHQTISCIKSLLSSVFPERFLTIHLMFDYKETTQVVTDIMSFLQSVDVVGGTPLSQGPIRLTYEKVDFVISRQTTTGLCHAQAAAFKQISQMYRGQTQNLFVALLEPNLVLEKECLFHLIRSIEKQRSVVGMTGTINYTDDNENVGLADKIWNKIGFAYNALEKSMEAASGHAGFLPTSLMVVRFDKALPIVENYFAKPVRQMLHLHSFASSFSFFEVALANHQDVAPIGYCALSQAYYQVHSSESRFRHVYIRPMALSMYRLTNMRLWGRGFILSLVKLLSFGLHIPGILAIPMCIYAFYNHSVLAVIAVLFVIPTFFETGLLIAVKSASSTNLKYLGPFGYPIDVFVSVFLNLLMGVYEAMPGDIDHDAKANLGSQRNDVESGGGKQFPDLFETEPVPILEDSHYDSAGTDSQNDPDSDEESAPTHTHEPSHFGGGLKASKSTANMGQKVHRSNTGLNSPSSLRNNKMPSMSNFQAKRI